MATAKELHLKRIAAGIPAVLLAARARINRGRLSTIEREYVQPTLDELTRVNTALAELIEAKAIIDRTAAEVGWPMEVRHEQ